MRTIKGERHARLITFSLITCLRDVLELSVNISDLNTPTTLDEPMFASAKDVKERVSADGLHVRELVMWVHAIQSFLNLSNQPYNDAARAQIFARNLKGEALILRDALRYCLQLAMSFKPSQSNVSLDVRASSATLSGASNDDRNSISQPFDESLSLLCEVLDDAYALSDSLVTAPHMNSQTWCSLERILRREFERVNGQFMISPLVQRATLLRQHPELQDITKQIEQEGLVVDLSAIFSTLILLLEHLQFVEDFMRRDLPLKQTLPIFTLIRQETRTLIDMIEQCAAQLDQTYDALFNALDGTGYAVSMEMQKVFAHELNGFAALKQAPPIYTKTENAYGLLRDCFQQSIISLAQVFNPTLDGTRLFNGFQTKLQQSLMIRRDLWTLLLNVRRAETERDRRPIAPLIELLTSFQEGSLRFLMYKDWEACRGFVEEVIAARGAAELAPVLHRFGTYLQTLLGQINMRVVLSDHPFDFPPLEE